MPKPIWYKGPPTGDAHYDVGLSKHIGIELIEAGDDFLKGRMPVDDRTLQPFGLLHGGASVVLAETLASIASAATVDLERQTIVGLEINANHLRGVRKGYVTGIARPIHLGRTTQVWDIRLFDEDGKPTCISRCTTAIIERRAADQGHSADAQASGSASEDQSEGHPS